MEVALVQYDIAWEDKAVNHARIEAMLHEADVPGGTFVLLPELGDTGFSTDLDAITGAEHDSIAWATDLARRRDLFIQVGHAVRAEDGMGLNCATIVRPDATTGTYAKVHPMSLLGETRSFRGGDSLLLADIGPLCVAPKICYDLRFPELFRISALEGAQLFSIGACWPVERIDHWRALLVARALEGQAWVMGCNRVGDDPNLSYGGTSMIIAPDGTVLAEADRQEEIVLRATLDIPMGARFREQFPVLQDTRRDLLGSIEIVRA
jgi:predicted amidohydrolase